MNLILSILTILEFLFISLAFTFNLSSNRFDARKQFMLEEVNSIETSWLRAGLVAQPYSDQLKNALVDYVEVRFSLINNPDKAQEGIKKSVILQNEMWSHITKMTQENGGDSRINALLIDSINFTHFDYDYMNFIIESVKRGFHEIFDSQKDFDDELK